MAVFIKNNNNQLVPVGASVKIENNTLKNLLDNTKSCYYLFNNYQGNNVSNLISYSDTENVTNMSYMFANCTALTSIPLLDTSNVTNMSNMFYGCQNITSIPLLDTSNVTNMSNMFYGCQNITSIPLLDTSNVTNMNNMFSYCYNLTSIPALNTSNVTNMYYMFYNCVHLTSVPALDMSHVSSQGNFNDVFHYCSALETIHATGMKWNFNISASTLFTEQALVEIIGNLATVDSTKTLTMGATNLAKLTAEEIAVATAKGWTLA